MEVRFVKTVNSRRLLVYIPVFALNIAILSHQSIYVQSSFIKLLIKKSLSIPLRSEKIISSFWKQQSPGLLISMKWPVVIRTPWAAPATFPWMRSPRKSTTALSRGRPRLWRWKSRSKVVGWWGLFGWRFSPQNHGDRRRFAYLGPFRGSYVLGMASEGSEGSQALTDETMRIFQPQSDEDFSAPNFWPWWWDIFRVQTSLRPWFFRVPNRAQQPLRPPRAGFFLNSWIKSRLWIPPSYLPLGSLAP